MALLEQYPDYAMETNAQGQRVTKPYVSGPSPLSMGLMTAGLGMLAQPEDESGWVTNGGSKFDFSNIAKGGLLGLQAFGEGHKNLQDQRNDFYTQRNASENQMINNQNAVRDQEIYKTEKDRKRSMIESFPELISKLQQSNIPGIASRIPILQAQAEGGNIEGAYQTITNLNSQLAKATAGKPELITFDNGQTVLVQKNSDGGFTSGTLSTPTKKSETGFLGNSMYAKAVALFDGAISGKNGLRPTDNQLVVALESLQKPYTVRTLDPATGTTYETERKGYVPPSIAKFMNVESSETSSENNSGSANNSLSEKPKGRIVSKTKLSGESLKALGYANRMQKSMKEMDDLMSDGYRPSRIPLEFVKMGAPTSVIGRLEKEGYRLKMSPEDRVYARAIQDWLRAKLRKESGAVISASEASEEMEAFFNVPVPNSETSADKVFKTYRSARITALESMIGESQGAYNRWEEFGYDKKPRKSKYFYDNSPFKSKTGNVHKNLEALRNSVKETN